MYQPRFFSVPKPCAISPTMNSSRCSNRLQCAPVRHQPSAVPTMDATGATANAKVDHEPFLEFYRLCEAGDTKEVKDKLEFELAAKFTWLNGRHPKTLATPLWAACMNGASEVVKVLLAEGADPMLRARACKEHFCRRGYDSPCRGYEVPEVPEDPGTLPGEIAVRRHHTLCAQLIRRKVTEERARYYEPEVWSPDLDKRKLRASEAQSQAGAKLLELPPLRFEARFHRACADGDFATVELMIGDFDARCAVLLDEGPTGSSVLELSLGGGAAGGDDEQSVAMNTSDVYNQGSEEDEATPVEAQSVAGTEAESAAEAPGSTVTFGGEAGGGSPNKAKVERGTTTTVTDPPIPNHRPTALAITKLVTVTTPRIARYHRSFDPRPPRPPLARPAPSTPPPTPPRSTPTSSCPSRLGRCCTRSPSSRRCTTPHAAARAGSRSTCSRRGPTRRSWTAAARHPSGTLAGLGSWRLLACSPTTSCRVSCGGRRTTTESS